MDINISVFSTDLRYSFASRSPVILLTFEGVTNIIFPIPSEKYVFHRDLLVCIGNVGQKVRIYYLFFSAKAQEKQNRKLGKLCSTVSLNV